MRKMKSSLYKDTKSWNPFVGCLYNCIYCKPSYQRLVAWNGRCLGCKKCESFTPHEHPERLKRVPRDKVIFVCSNGDLAFAKKSYIRKILEVMRNDKRERTWLLQSKNPIIFKEFLNELPSNTFLLTTLETNRDKGYRKISKAPLLSKRYKDFLELKWEKKIVTIEPVIDFDLKEFSKWLLNIRPEVVFIGYNSHPKFVQLEEPTWNKVLDLMIELRRAKIPVLPKLIRKFAYWQYFEMREDKEGR